MDSKNLKIGTKTKKYAPETKKGHKKVKYILQFIGGLKMDTENAKMRTENKKIDTK